MAPHSWLDGCIRQVTYWVDQALARRADPGYDYQHMALVADVYDVERSVQARALAVQGRHGDVAARQDAVASAYAGCMRVARDRAGEPVPSSTYGWPN